MRIRCLLGFLTTLSLNMAMKMVYGASNFDSHTLNKKILRFREVEGLIKIGLNVRTKLKYKLMKLIRISFTDEDRVRQAKVSILRLISSQVL